MAVGCHKKAPATPPPSAASQPAQPGVAETPQPLVGEVNPLLTSQLHTLVQQKGRMPADFAEFSHWVDLVPRVPAGKKWAIDPATKEVKLVNQ
jgi:hypothetical protein